MAILEETPASIEECAIGYYIPPNESYCLIKNDIIVEFKNAKISAYQVVTKDNLLVLDKFCENVDDNIFFRKFCKVKTIEKLRKIVNNIRVAVCQTSQ